MHRCSPVFALLLTATGLSVGACATETDSPRIATLDQQLVGGELNTGDPGVVSLASFGNSNCTGTLVAPQTILTAAHCVDALGNDPEISIFFGDDINGQGLFVPTDKRGTHPAWGGNLGTNDIGMVIIERPVNQDWIVPMNDVPITAADVGTDYRHVGFGVFSIQNGQTQADGRKRTGTVQIEAIDGRQNIISGNDEIAVCFGDSGGPGLIERDGVEYVAGVHSFTSSGCTGDGGDTRVDLHLTELILPYIQANDPTCDTNFICAAGGCTDDPDCAQCGAGNECVECPGAADPDCPNRAVGDLCELGIQCPGERCIVWTDLSTRFCSAECDPANDTCPDGMSCQNTTLGNVCFYDEAPAGALGTDCATDSDCATGLCRDQSCTFDCGPVSGKSCPEGFECVEGDNFESTCAGEGGGGCSTGGSAGGAGFILLLGLALTLRRRS